jgi:predicted O-methyltransferase YrrM
LTIRISNQLFGTQPIAAHCPGPLSDRWHRFYATVIAQPARACPTPDVTVITWNNGQSSKPFNKACGALEASLQRLGVEAVPLTQNERPWCNLDKLRLTAKALRSVTTPYVIGADSSDCVFLDSPQLAVDRFRAHFDCSLLFNGTGSRCWPELPAFVQYQQSLPLATLAQGRHWINAGLFIGKTEFCREYFRVLAEAEPVQGFIGSDQAVVMATLPQWYPQVQIDYFSQLFQWFNEELRVMRLERPLALRHAELLRWIRPLGHRLTGAEIGVFQGHTSEALLRELPELSLWLVDPWRPYAGRSTIGDQSAEQLEQAMQTALLWTEFADDRRFVLREPSPQAAARFQDASLDFVFIDGNHLYESVCADIDAWWPKLRTGGLLIGHDYCTGRDAEGLWGVKRAVDEFHALTHRELQLGRDGTWCLQR